MGFSKYNVRDQCEIIDGDKHEVTCNLWALRCGGKLDKLSYCNILNYKHTQLCTGCTSCFKFLGLHSL